MKALLAIVGGGKDEAEGRIAALEEKFPDRQFTVEEKDRKHAIVCTNAENMNTPDLETMRGIARGSVGTVEDAAKQPEKTTPAPAPKTAALGGPGPATGGTGASPATPRPAT